VAPRVPPKVEPAGDIHAAFFLMVQASRSCAGRTGPLMLAHVGDNELRVGPVEGVTDTFV